MVGWLFLTLGIAFGSAVIPVFSIEVFVIGLMASNPGIPWLAVGAAVAVGQVAGKLLYYLAARGSIRLPRFLQDRLQRERRSTSRREFLRAKTKWLQVKLSVLRERCLRNPLWMNGTYGISALVGLPPFMATTVLAGLVRMRLSTFLVTGLLGRLVRFSVLAGSPSLFTQWLQF
jgi:membrane protein YqaA with SNARE-associated domain